MISDGESVNGLAESFKDDDAARRFRLHTLSGEDDDVSRTRTKHSGNTSLEGFDVKVVGRVVKMKHVIGLDDAILIHVVVVAEAMKLAAKLFKRVGAVGQLALCAKRRPETNLLRLPDRDTISEERNSADETNDAIGGDGVGHLNHRATRFRHEELDLEDVTVNAEDVEDAFGRNSLHV